MQVTIATRQAWLSLGLILVFFPATFFTSNLPTSSSGGWESSPGVSHEVMYYLTQSVLSPSPESVSCPLIN